MTSSTPRRTMRQLAARLAALTLIVPLSLVATAPAASAVEPCGPGGNAIACENSLPGTDPAVWDYVTGAGDADIQGFATDMSVNVGDEVGFKIDTDAAAYTIDVYRTGWYGGLGARHIASVQPTAPLPQTQPDCVTESETGLVDCGNWALSASWDVPQDAVSGVYIALLHRADTDGTSHITFIVRDDASQAAVVFQTADTTWQAYNTYGGSSLYEGGPVGRAYKVSYNRPFNTRGLEQGRDFYFSSEYAMVRFLERNGYDVTYISGVDSDRSGAQLVNHDVFVSVGHDEYWSYDQRQNVEAARDAGVNLAFFSGNEAYWETRWEDSVAGAATPYRTLVSYKETKAGAKIDPSPQWTGTWRDPRFASQADGGGLPENNLTGTAYMINFSDLPVTVSAEEGKLRLWRNTPLAEMAPGTSAALAPHTVGYESNEDLDNGFRPEGLIRLSTTVGAVPEVLQDFGSVVLPGVTTHHTTTYRASSGALVFSAGSVQWSWGLDQEHDGDGAPADARMQQATVNLLADMGTEPQTLMPTLVPASASTDSSPPTLTFSSPAPGAPIANGATVVATGTATDAGGGRVAGVEVSTDGGTSWHPAEGTTDWTYTYVQHGLDAVPLLARAIDDSANIGAPVQVAPEVSGPSSIFGSVVPEVVEEQDPVARELGLRFTPELDGFVNGVRFYKGPQNTGTHVGTLWNEAGQALATVTFTDETESGWQTALFGSSVAVTAGNTYVVSYTAPSGRYAAASDAFWYAGIDAPPLSVEGGFGSEPAGVYGTPGAFPTASYQRSHYFVDVVFERLADAPLTLTAVSPLAGASSVPWSSPVSAVLSKPVVESSVGLSLVPDGGSPVAGNVAYDAETRTVTFTPAAALAAGTSFTATVSAQDAQGSGITGPASFSFVSALADQSVGVCPCSVFEDSTVPEVLADSDSAAVTLGMRFATDVDGSVTGVRFYKGPANTGSHTGSLWSGAGALLAQGTFSGESVQGWQTLTFAEPVEVTADTDYLVSYRTQVGAYSYTADGLATQLVKGPLRTALNGGRYSYADAFPTSGSSASYLVDVVFEADPAPLLLVGTSPPADSLGVATDVAVSATYGRALAAGSTVEVRPAGGSPIAGTTTLSGDGTTLTFQPATALALSTAYVVEVRGVEAADGVVAADASWTFTTGGEDGCPCTLFSGEVPALSSADDPNPYELGVSFTPSAFGEVTGVRFYKGPGNTGTHTGTLWEASGAQLATVTFTAETATGWQTASFETPVLVSAGTTYVVSYSAPAGGYAATTGFFTQDHAVGPLTAPAAGNGRYGSIGSLPTSTYSATNYFVDVVFRTVALVPPEVTGTAPPNGTADVSLSSSVSATLSKPADVGTPVLVLTGPAGSIDGTSDYDATAQRIVFTPAGPLPAAATISATASLDGTPLAGGSWSFTTADAAPPEGTCPCTLWTDADAPAVSAWDDPVAVQVGVGFTTSLAGTVTGVRYYKGLSNSGTHTVNLWDSTGTLLASAVGSAESAAGWQTVSFAEPVAVVAGGEYVASYHTTSGNYSLTSGGLTDPVSRGPLSSIPNGGRYLYGSGFPAQSTGSNYWVDPVFQS